MESWHALLQKNVLDRRRWRTGEELHNEVVFWTEHTYNRRRRQRRLGKLTPVEFELAFTTPHHTPQSRHDQSQPPSTEAAAVPRDHAPALTGKPSSD